MGDGIIRDDPLPWTVESTTTAFRNRWVKVDLDEVRLPNGKTYEYTRLDIKGAGVGVIGFNAAGDQVLLEREYRHGIGEVIWQCPGGLVDQGEDLATAGLRELKEETGYAPAEVSPETVRYLGSIWDAPPLGRARNHIYAAWGLTKVADIKPDEAEFVTCHWRSVAWLKDAVRTGEIQDRFVVAAVSYLLLNDLI